MEKCSLPLANSPIKYLQLHAYRLSIILHHEESWPWFYSNFIQLVGRQGENPTEYRIDFLTPSEDFHTAFPWLDYCPLIKDVFLGKLGCDIHELLQASLQEQFYIYTLVDEYYIPHRRSYQQQHFHHDVLIKGYDLTDRTYTIVGYDENMIYRETKVRFEQMAQAMKSVDAPITQIYKKGIHYELDMEAIQNALTDYLDSYNSTKRLRSFINPLSDQYDFGIGVYHGFLDHLDRVREDKLYYDIRLTHLLMEHKQCMSMRLEYLNGQHRLNHADELLNKPREMVDLAMRLRHAYLKISLGTNKEAIERVRSLSVNLKEVDEALTENILKNLVI
ncbi:hypothetical protein C0Q44_18310 [Paenibacillus sp. PCH8]|uniref:hypothetical protein n=1 Tax=Paenibacillus sp. PCH8 TaxID=2066524 RepID=UPI000CFA4782|nr:hypothetical protein [Paenibacillus sp. PCH8]PQP81655.1 hypothetical protein C0Q44_18310 [Paenibacillus sp. PCH8]